MLSAAGPSSADATLPASFQQGMDAVSGNNPDQFSDVFEQARKKPTGSSISQSFIEKEEGPANLSGKEKLKKVAEEMEGLFLNMLMKQMRETVPDSGYVERSEAEKMFQKQLDQRYAQDMAEDTDLGIAEAIYDQFTENGHVPETSSDASTLNLTG